MSGIGGFAIAVAFSVAFDLDGADINGKIEAYGFAAGEAQKVGDLLGLTGGAAGGNPLAEVGKGDGGHDCGNGDDDQQFD